MAASLGALGLGATLARTTATRSAVSAVATRSLASAAAAAASKAASDLSVVPTEVSTLSNGIRVASEGSSDAGETLTVGVFIDAGSRYETADNNGVAHFLEHMAFKGTSSRTQQDIEVEVENIGGHLNAYTSREQTVYYAKVTKKDLPHAVDILADILQESSFDEAKINAERGVILREMESVEEQTEEVVFDQLHAAAFQGTPLAQTILGPRENIAKISKNDLTDFIKTHYTGPRMVVAAAGAVDHNELVKLSEAAFKSVSATNNVESVTPAEPDQGMFTASDVRIWNDDMPAAHLAIAVEGVGWTHADYFPMMIAQTVVGAWDHAAGGGQHMSSQLAGVVASNHLAHSYASFHTAYNDTGLWGTYAVAPAHALDDIVYVIEQEYVRLAFSPTETEVERAKNQLKTNMMMQLDGSTAICEDIGRQMLTYRRRMSPAEIYARIDAVTADDIKRVANEYIYGKSPAVAAVGPIKEMPDTARLSSWNYWIRA